MASSTPRGYTATKDQLQTRLRRIEGQVRGIQGMVDEDRYCIDVITQISAIQAALDKVALGLLDEHARHCIIHGPEDLQTTAPTSSWPRSGVSWAVTSRQHHQQPTPDSSLNKLAFSATVHCLTGCAIGETLGMVIGTAAGFSDLGTIVLAIGLAFLFGYGLTSLPLLRAGMPLSAVVPLALASDTISITIMEIVDNAIMLAIPGAMDAGAGDPGFYVALAFALLVAGAFAFPANRWLISRGKGHAVVHSHHAH